VSKTSDQIIADAGFIPQRLRPAAAEAPPPLPTVGRIVHFYCKNWGRVGPWAAVVSGVDIQSETGSPEVVATISLTVAGFGHINPHHDAKEDNRPWVDIVDVPGIIPGVDHQHEYWWQWPERG
jgi:hypothetical protein